MVYLISYDLKKPGQDYTAVHEAIKSLGDWAKPLESLWFVDTNFTYEDVYDRVHAAMDTNDNLLVMKASIDYVGHFSTEVHNWLKSRLS